MMRICISILAIAAMAGLGGCDQAGTTTGPTTPPPPPSTAIGSDAATCDQLAAEMADPNGTTFSQAGARERFVNLNCN